MVNIATDGCRKAVCEHLVLERRGLKTALILRSKTELILSSVSAGSVQIPSDWELLNIGPYGHVAVDKLKEALSSHAGGPLSLMFSKGMNTQAVEQSWHVFNRYKKTLRRTGPRMYFFLLHLLGHLMNKEKWIAADL